MSEELLCWPDWMPVPLRDGYGYEPADRRVKSEMEIGTVNRVEFDADENTIQCSLALDETQSLFFETFEHDCLRQGTRAFRIPVRMADKVESYKATFASRPKMTGILGVCHLRYSFSLRIEKRNLMDGDAIGLLLVMSPAAVSMVSGRLHDVLHRQMPGVTHIPPDIWN